MLLRRKIILNIFSFRVHRTLKSISKFISKIYFLFNLKLNGQKLEFNTPLISYTSKYFRKRTKPRGEFYEITV